MSCESIRRYPRVAQCGNNNLVFLVFLPVSARDNVVLPQRDSVPASVRGSFVPSLRETMLLCLSETSVPASVRGIVVSLYLAFSVHARFLPFCLFLGWLMHASHMLSYRICSGPLTICFCSVILRIKTACLIVIDISDIQRASRVSSSGSILSLW